VLIGSGDGEREAIVHDVGHGLAEVEEPLTEKRECNGVKGAHSGCARFVLADTEMAEAPSHFTGGLSGKGDGKYVLCACRVGEYTVCDAVGKHPCLS
jgi:hypothetical protein